MLTDHHRQPLQGCLPIFVGKKPADTYVLQFNPSVSLQPGERVRLKGKKVHGDSGQNLFEVHGLAKEYGACS